MTKALLDSGQSMAAQQRGCPPLMYEWHEKKYLGAAHGLAGILYTLLLVRQIITFGSICSSRFMLNALSSKYVYFMYGFPFRHFLKRIY